MFFVTVDGRGIFSGRLDLYAETFPVLLTYLREPICFG